MEKSRGELQRARLTHCPAVNPICWPTTVIFADESLSSMVIFHGRLGKGWIQEPQGSTFIWHEDRAFEWGKMMMGMNLVLDMTSGHPKLTNKSLGLEKELASLEMKP